MATRKTAKPAPLLLDDVQLLQQQAQARKRKEVELVVARIREAMAFWGITEEDLGFAKRPAVAAPAPVAVPAPAKKKRKSRYTERPLAGPRN